MDSKSTPKPNNTQQVAASKEAPTPSTTTANRPGPSGSGHQQWQVVENKKRNANQRKKEKRAAKRAANAAQTSSASRQPPATRQEGAKGSAPVPAAGVGAKPKNRPGSSRGGFKQRAEKAAQASQSAEGNPNALKGWRKRGSRGQRGKPGPGHQGNQGKVPKRPRPNDTQSPSNPHAKRPKPSTSLVGSAATYADAVVLNDLFVAVMPEPFTDLTPEQVEEIKGMLVTSIDRLTDALMAKEHVPYFPSFLGKPFHSEGVLKLQCENEKAVEWLKTTVATYKSPIPESVLVVKRQKDIPKRVKSAVLLPDCSDDAKRIRCTMWAQNSWYDIDRWSLYHIERQEGNPPSTFLVLGIPADQIPVILARNRKLCYKLGNAYIRFFGSSGRLQDLPPDPAETATAPTDTNAPSAPQQSVSASRDLGAGASVSQVSRPNPVEGQDLTGEPKVPQHSSAERRRQDGETSACTLTSPLVEVDSDDLEEDVAQLMDLDIRSGTDEEVSSPIRSSSPH